MSNLRSDARGVVADRPPGDLFRTYIERLCFQIDDVEERWHRAERATKLNFDEVDRLRAAIRAHRDQRGDDRCWIDDYALYGILPEGAPIDATALPPREEFLKSCERYYDQRRCPLDQYPAGKMRIAELEAEVERLKEFEAMHLAARQYTCPRCKAVARDPDDVAQRYCPACQRFSGTDEV